MRSVNLFVLDEWDSLVKKTYNKHYSLQQQDGRMPKGTTVHFSVPNNESDEFYPDRTPQTIRKSEMGVKFSAWLNGDPDLALYDGAHLWETALVWERNFYPNLDVLAQDMHSRGILQAGEYVVEIDW